MSQVPPGSLLPQEGSALNTNLARVPAGGPQGTNQGRVPICGVDPPETVVKGI